ncbi:MAG: hypothetical protein HN661_01605 [Gammaproteobacteria bacterium]|nr:hypothetical protein [Gammaproteobacteria bacterium]HIJ47033.1 hypothetical protein [Gammaproteobacteria bacterium]
MMNRIIDWVEWLGEEWLRFLVWFVVGLIALPMGISAVTGWINLDRFYDGLVPGNFNLGVMLLVVAPYVLYLGYRLIHFYRVERDEFFEDDSIENAA